VTICTSYLQGLVIRATKLDSCGAPLSGVCSTVVSKGFVTIELEADETSGSEIAPTLADGTRCYYYTSPKLLNGIKANIEFCTVDPDLFNLLTGAPVVLDDSTPTPQSIGFTTDSASYGVANVALELWMNRADGGCLDATSRKWGYYLMPWIHQGTVGKPTIENDAVNFSVSEAMTRDGNQWGVGPYNVQLDNAGTPSPLFEALASTVHDLLMPVNLAPPTPVCGCQELIIPT
jgi:hypothetical protein